jgi:hypothetical protein
MDGGKNMSEEAYNVLLEACIIQAVKDVQTSNKALKKHLNDVDAMFLKNDALTFLQKIS